MIPNIYDLRKDIGEIPDDPGLTGEEEDEELWEEIENEDYFIRLPEQYELHEKRIMEDFTETCTRGNVANRLWRALNSRHPYRCFKDAINEAGIAQKYYDFRTMTFLCMAEEWCRENGVRFFRKEEKT